MENYNTKVNRGLYNCYSQVEEELDSTWDNTNYPDTLVTKHNHSKETSDRQELQHNDPLDNNFSPAVGQNLDDSHDDTIVTDQEVEIVKVIPTLKLPAAPANNQITTIPSVYATNSDNKISLDDKHTSQSQTNWEYRSMDSSSTTSKTISTDYQAHARQIADVS